MNFNVLESLFGGLDMSKKENSINITVEKVEKMEYTNCHGDAYINPVIFQFPDKETAIAVARELQFATPLVQVAAGTEST